MAKFVFCLLLNFLVVSSFELAKDSPNVPDLENSIDLTESSQIATTLVPSPSSSEVNSSNDSPLTSASNNQITQTSSKRSEEANSTNDSISLLIVDRVVDLTTVTSQPAQTTFNSTNFDFTQSTRTSIAVSEKSTTIPGLESSATNSVNSSSSPTISVSSPSPTTSESSTTPTNSEKSTSLESSTASPSISRVTSISPIPTISSISSNSSTQSPRRKLNCNQTPQGRIKIDCKRYFRCVRSKTRFALRVNTCKKDEYFDEQTGLCRTATKGENLCDSNTAINQQAKTSTGRKTGGTKRRKNRNKTKSKRNRALNAPRGVIRLSFNDFDLDDEDDVDLDRLNHRLSNHRSDYENSHVIVITDHEDDEDFDTENSYETLEGGLARSDEQTEQDDSGMEEKRTEQVSPCMSKKKLDDLQSDETVVGNRTEVHIGNQVIDTSDEAGGLLSPKQKINIKRKENELAQNEDRGDENLTSPVEADRKRRVPKNVTNITQESHYTRRNSSQLDERKEHQNEASGEQSGKNRRVITNTTIIEEHYGGNDKLVDEGRKEKEAFEHHQNSKIVIKNATSTTEHHLGSHKENASSGENTSRSENTSNENASSGHKGKKIFKNVTTIITEEETSESKRNDQMNHSNEIEKKTIDQPSPNDSGRIVTKNETITITTEEGAKKASESSKVEPVKKSAESSSDQFHSGKKIVKNITIITEETNEGSSSKRDESGERRNVIVDQIEHVNQGSKPEISNDGSKRIIKNVTTIITEEEENAKRVEPSNHFDKITTKNSTIDPVEHVNQGLKPEVSNDGSKRIIKNVTTIITEEEENEKRAEPPLGKITKNVTIDQTEHDNQVKKPATSNEGSRWVIKNVTTIITEEEENEKRKVVEPSTDHFGIITKNVTIDQTEQDNQIRKPEMSNDGSKRIIKNVTTIITEEEENAKRVEQPSEKITTRNSTIDQVEHVKQGLKPEISNDGSKRIIKNVTTIITEEEENEKRIEPPPNQFGKIIKNVTIDQTERDNQIEKPVSSNEGSRWVIKNVTTIITEEEESAKRNVIVEPSKNVTIDRIEHINQGEKPEISNDHSIHHDGSKRIIKNVTTIITEEEENAKRVEPSFGKITKNVTIDETNIDSEHQSESGINQPESSPITSKNESKALDSSELPCGNRFNHLKPIAKIIETHHVIKTLFGSSTNFLKTNGFVNFVRYVRKNVTKVIQPNNLDDATSLILDRNVPDYLVNEVHESEEKVIFEGQAGEVANAIDSHANRPSVESTSQRPAPCHPDPGKETASTAPIDSFKPLEPFSPTKPPNSHGIDPHGSIDASTTPSPVIVDPQGPKNSDYPSTSTTPSSIPGEQPFDFATPQGPVYFDDTGDCRSEGFHLDVNDASCQRFYLCKVDLSTGRFTVEQFLCVPGQVFVPERKVCVYEQMAGPCLQKQPLESNESTTASLASKSEHKEKPKDGSLASDDGPTNNTTDPSIRPLTGVPILFTEAPNEARRQKATAEKPVSALDGYVKNGHVSAGQYDFIKNSLLSAQDGYVKNGYVSAAQDGYVKNGHVSAQDGFVKNSPVIAQDGGVKNGLVSTAQDGFVKNSLVLAQDGGVKNGLVPTAQDGLVRNSLVLAQDGYVKNGHVSAQDGFVKNSLVSAQDGGVKNGLVSTAQDGYVKNNYVSAQDGYVKNGLVSTAQDGFVKISLVSAQDGGVKNGLVSAQDGFVKNGLVSTAQDGFVKNSPLSAQVGYVKNSHISATLKSSEDPSEESLGSSSERSEHHSEVQPNHYSSSDEVSDRVHLRTSSSSVRRLNQAQQRTQFATYQNNNRFLPFSVYPPAQFSPISQPFYAGPSIVYNQLRPYQIGGLFPPNGFRMVK